MAPSRLRGATATACGSRMNLGYQSPTPQLPARLQINLLRDGVSVSAASRAWCQLAAPKTTWGLDMTRSEARHQREARQPGSKSTAAGSKRTCCHPRNGRREKFAGHPIFFGEKNIGFPTEFSSKSIHWKQFLHDVWLRWRLLCVSGNSPRALTFLHKANLLHCGF